MSMILFFRKYIKNENICNVYFPVGEEKYDKTTFVMYSSNITQKDMNPMAECIAGKSYVWTRVGYLQ